MNQDTSEWMERLDARLQAESIEDEIFMILAVLASLAGCLLAKGWI